MSEEWHRQQHEQRMAEERERLNEASRRSMFDDGWRAAAEAGKEAARQHEAYQQGASGREMPRDPKYWSEFQGGANARGSSHHAGREDRTPTAPSLSEQRRAQLFSDGYYGVCLDFGSLWESEVSAVLEGQRKFLREFELSSDEKDLALRVERGETYSPFNWYRTYHPISAMLAGFDGRPTPTQSRTSEGARWCFSRGRDFGLALNAFKANLSAHQAKVEQRRRQNILFRALLNEYFPIETPYKSSDVAHAEYLILLGDWYASPANNATKTASRL